MDELNVLCKFNLRPVLWGLSNLIRQQSLQATFGAVSSLTIITIKIIHLVSTQNFPKYLLFPTPW